MMKESEERAEGKGEDLTLENDLLKLQMTAEFGARFGSNPDKDLDPAIENEWLKYIQNFEKAYANCKMVTVFEKLGSPVFMAADEMKREDFKKALSRMHDLLASKNLYLDICDGPYPDDVIYRFITEELMKQEVEDLQVEGMMTHFIYEEFHPNNKADIEKRSLEFLSAWVDRAFNEYNPSLSKYLLSPNGKRFTEEEFLKKVRLFFNAYERFDNAEYHIQYSEFEMVENDENLSALGFTEGQIKYDAVLEKGEKIHYEGRFKIYLSRRWDYWSINSFIMPGFQWTVDNSRPADASRTGTREN